MATRRSVGAATAILTAVASLVFIVSSVAVSSASSPGNPNVAFASPYPFGKLALTGAVSTSGPGTEKSFTLSFTTSFTLAQNSPGIVSGSSLGNVMISQHVAYPVPAHGSFVGPAALPFATESLRLRVTILGRCFPNAPAAGAYVFTGSVAQCVAASLTLGSKTYSVKRLLLKVGGTFTPDPTGAGSWTGMITATFLNPGYTFPVATLGSGGNTTHTIGSNDGAVATQSITFGG